MPKQPLRDQYLAALLAIGGQQVQGTFKSFKVTHPLSPDRFYYVGKSGSLRVGNTTRDSKPCAPSFKQRLLTTPTGEDEYIALWNVRLTDEHKQPVKIWRHASGFFWSFAHASDEERSGPFATPRLAYDNAAAYAGSPAVSS